MRDLLRRAAWRTLGRLEPTLADDLALLDYCRRWVVPPATGTEPAERPFVPARRPGCPGIALDAEGQAALLSRWGREHADLFGRLREDPRINTECRGKPYLHNGMYPTPDAEIYAAMICDFAPRRIVEVGGGYSTLIARAAVAAQGGGCLITVVDPEPRTDVAGAADDLIRQPVEDGALERLAPEGRLLLFIDSSHILRAGGDVAYLFTRLLPRLAPGSLVHVHDIFLPYDYPQEYRRRLYTEQYLLQALLAHSGRYRVVLATHWMAREHPEAMQAALGPAVGRDPGFYGASLWFQVV